MLILKMSTVQTEGLDGTIINNQYSKNQKQPLLLFGSFWQYNFPKSFDWDDFCPFLEKEIEDAKNLRRFEKFSSQILKFSQIKRKKFDFSILSSSQFKKSHLLIAPRPRPRAPRLQLVGRPPVVEVEAPQVSWAKRSRQRCASNFKQNNFIFLNKSHYDIDIQKKEIWTWYQQSTHIGRLGQTKITKEQGKVDPCRPPPRPLSAASLTAVCRTRHRSVAAARSATHGCRWWRPGGKEIVKDLDGYDENLREMDLFEQRMEKAKVSKELQKS